MDEAAWKRVSSEYKRKLPSLRIEIMRKYLRDLENKGANITAVRMRKVLEEDLKAHPRTTRRVLSYITGKTYDRVCPHCNKKFITTQVNVKYCSRNCLRKEMEKYKKRQMAESRKAKSAIRSYFTKLHGKR
jgi:hypothetical protein